MVEQILTENLIIQNYLHFVRNR